MGVRQFLVCYVFADDTCLMASDAAGLRKSLDVLVEWCKEWEVKISVAKSGATRRQRGVSWHMRWMMRQSQRSLHTNT